MSNPRRALWTFLLYMLAGPFFGASIVVIGFAAAWFWWNATLVDPSPVAKFVGLALALAAGELVIDAFVWSTIPAAIAALALAFFVLRRGWFGWPEAAVAGVAAFALAEAISPFSEADFLPWLAVLSGLASIGARAVLIEADVLRAA